MQELAVIILAAGQGKRFNSALPKIAHHVAGRSLVGHVLHNVAPLKPQRTVVVVSPQVEPVLREHLGAVVSDCEFVVQQSPRGTADAVMVARKVLRGFTGHVLILAGDVPLVQSKTLKRFVKAATAAKAPGAVLSMLMDDPHGYGRVVVNDAGELQAIVEEKDASDAQRLIDEVNSGIFCCEAKWLFRALSNISTDNAQSEYYLTDIATVAATQGSPLRVSRALDSDEFHGVNTRADLAFVEALFRLRLTDYWMERGVTFRDPDSVQLDCTVKIGRDTIVGPQVALSGNTVIGNEVQIDQGAVLTDTRVDTGVHIKPYTVIENSRVGAQSQLGPFARLRPGTRLDAGVRIGNFVETKATWLKRGAKANHLSYLGDATVGAESNIGCGTITCNYDGQTKHKTVIGDRVFVGSDSQLVAPVKVGADAVIAAGSVITENVPKESLAIARGRQIVKRAWKRKVK